MRVVLDTNVLARASYSATGPAAELFEQLRQPEHVLITSSHIASELDRVLRYPRLRRLHGFNDEEIERFVTSVKQVAVVITLSQEVPAVAASDPDDDPIVATAVAGEADVLCTRDNDLHSRDVIEYCSRHNIRVLTDVELLQDFRAQKRSDQ